MYCTVCLLAMVSVFSPPFTRRQAAHPGWNPGQLEQFAAAQFEKAALDLLVATVLHIHTIRPKLKVGMYSLPDRFYYHGCE